MKEQYFHSKPNHVASWIYNWCIWKNYWKIFYKNYENCENPETQLNNFHKLVKYNEYVHLKLILSSRNLEKESENIKNEIESFSFFHLDKGKIINIEIVEIDLDESNN